MAFGNRVVVNVISQEEVTLGPLTQHDWCPYKTGSFGHTDAHSVKT